MSGGAASLDHICIIQGHRDARGAHLCHGLADAYRHGALDAAHQVSDVDIGSLPIDFLRNPEDMARPPNEAILAAQQTILEAEHLMITYPLWLGTMPALVKAFFEQAACGDFFLGKTEKGWPLGKLKGRSARLVVTMGMPAAAYRLLMGGHGVKGFESGILGIAGIGPIRETPYGNVEGSAPARIKWLAKMRDLGARAR